MVVRENGLGFSIDTEGREPTLNELVREYTLAVYRKYAGKSRPTVISLGISYSGFYQKLRRYRAEKRNEARKP